ncbi:DUF7490 domain-containing protein [Methanolobus psychrotolerans]|uniref:DUF7490 domain-containing protein n=1 Tax=Methanolobus psychrotolerans TaxID=1874706 RepID=UPI000B918868|nr:hypothetical protein [Methanolobus psychrotolerans]
MFSAASGGCLREFDEETKLRITDIEMSVDSVKSTYAWFNVTTYIENQGTDSTDNVSLMTKVFNQRTGLLELKQEKEIGLIAEEETRTIIETIHIPKSGNYRINVAVIEDGDVSSERQVSLSGIENLPTDLQETGIQIEGIDFIVRGVTAKGVVIENDIYLKNEGAETTEDYQILVKAREMDARLIADKKWISSGEIKPEETAIRSINLTVPDNYNYIVEISVWKGNTMIITGEDYVQLNPEKVIDRDQQVQNKNVDTGDFVVEEEWLYEEPEETSEEASPGFTWPFAAISLITALYMVRRRLQ